MEGSSKVLLISYAFLFFYLAIGIFNFSNFGLVNNSVDWDVHWNKVNDLNYSPSYPSAYHFLFNIFDSSQLLFYGVSLIIVCFLIPILLFLVTKTHWSAILYFCGISLPHVWIYGSTFPQAFVFMLILIYLANRKNPFVFLSGLILASLVHRHGAQLFALILCAEIIEFIFNKYLKEKLSLFVVLGVEKFNSIFEYLFYFLMNISFPVLIFSRSIIKNIFYLVLAVVPLFLLNYDARLLSVTQLALLIIASPKIAKSEHKWLISFILFWYLLLFLLGFAVGTSKLFI